MFSVQLYSATSLTENDIKTYRTTSFRAKAVYSLYLSTLTAFLPQQKCTDLNLHCLTEIFGVTENSKQLVIHKGKWQQKEHDRTSAIVVMVSAGYLLRTDCTDVFS